MRLLFLVEFLEQNSNKRLQGERESPQLQDGRVPLSYLLWCLELMRLSWDDVGYSRAGLFGREVNCVARASLNNEGLECIPQLLHPNISSPAYAETTVSCIYAYPLHVGTDMENVPGVSSAPACLVLTVAI